MSSRAETGEVRREKGEKLKGERRLDPCLKHAGIREKGKKGEKKVKSEKGHKNYELGEQNESSRRRRNTKKPLAVQRANNESIGEVTGDNYEEDQRNYFVLDAVDRACNDLPRGSGQ